MPISPARAAAFDVLLRVQRESSYASELLHSKAYESLSKPDHALLTELVMGVLRWRSRLDDAIAQASSQPLKKLDLEILISLRIAVYQFRWLTRVPQRAALHESVELVKRARKRSAAPFVNAVLRKLSKRAIDAEAEAADPVCSSVPSVVNGSTTQEIAIHYAHPLWLVERWAHQYGPSAARQICEHNQTIPTTTVRLRSTSADTELASEEISLLPGNLLSSARRVQSGDITQTRAFREGHVVIQDEASQLVAALVSRTEAPGLRILDCCAAPGGKTLAIADSNPTAEILALEVHPHRARLMQELVGSRAPNIQTLVADAREFPAADPFHRILADVPCSGTGTLARNPEIKWRLQPADLSELHERQIAIIRSAIAHLAPGGRLVYSTCSLEKEENEDVIDKVLAEDNSVRLINCAEELARLKDEGALIWSEPESLTTGPYLRTTPGVHPCDGFFAAVLEKSRFQT